MINGLLKDMELMAQQVFREYGIERPERFVNVNHEGNILHIEVNAYNHEERGFASFDVMFWLARQGETHSDGSKRRTMVIYRGHLTEMSLVMMNRLTAMLPDTWIKGTATPN